MANEEVYLRGILATIGRQAFPPEHLIALIASKGNGQKQAYAFNLCDGTRTQSEVAKAASFDPGNFSRLLQRWVDRGIVIKLEDGKPLHLYPLPSSYSSKINNSGGVDE